MAYVIEPANTFPAPGTRGRPFARMMAGVVSALSPRRMEPAKPVTTTPGPATEALIDADYERMASFGSWQALRDNLRETAAAPPRKRA